jgi:hypothetical protein
LNDLAGRVSRGPRGDEILATTRKTSPRTDSTKAESSEDSVGAGSADVDDSLSRVFSPPASESDATDGESVDQPSSQEQEVQQPAAAAAPAPPQPLTATQLLNDPLLGTHDEIVVDLGLKLRWAAIGYGLLGVVASWVIAAQVALATKDAAAFGWAIAATILIFAAGVWYFADVSSRFASIAAYRRAKTPQSIARLNRGGVVGLYGVVGAWIGAALGILVLVSGVTTAVLTIALGATGWTWFFGGIPVVLLYVFGFGLMHYRVIEKARDAVA